LKAEKDFEEEEWRGPPSSQGPAGEESSDEIVQMYFDALALMHDLLCRFVTSHGRPRFFDSDQLLQYIEEVDQRAALLVRVQAAFLPAIAILD
jgi:hypothetical protein